MEPPAEHSIHSASHLFLSDYNFSVGVFADKYISDIPEYQQAKADGKVLIVFNESSNIENSVLIFRCDYVEGVFQQDQTGKYLVPFRLISFYEVFEMGYSNPYMRDFQELMDQAVTAGLPRAWNTFYALQVNRKVPKEPSERSEMLNFDDIKKFSMMIFPIGFISAFIAFLMENIHQRFLRNVQWRVHGRNLMVKMRLRRPNPVRVRRIQVQPINE